MSSRRILKRIINLEVAELIDHCYDIATVSPEKEEGLGSIVDKAVELYDNVISEINAYKTEKNKSAYFAKIKSKMDKELAELNKNMTAL